MTLATHELPERLARQSSPSAMSGPAFPALIARFVSTYTEKLFNPHWGGRIAFPPFETLSVGMVSYGLDRAPAEPVWQPFLDGIADAPKDYRLTGKPMIADMATREWWDAEFRKKYTAEDIISDPRTERGPPRLFVGRRPRRDRRVLARFRDAMAAGGAARARPAAANRRRAIRGQPASWFRDPIRQGARRGAR